ncbi:hypothetical protein DAPPUDRAFT_341160 [Daphnia pulex]|uniref:Uncharacterized protein n=1 Tax=Daphnia pulex TaxID=6669 RepID=E9I577_DAPPU|nr:hypothetical protein DAPPUDRAFT_341160 [Daphnia pulex]|eukprot:EFX60853.1 hypothetical protein DAPPUDRAFT_341160 [Daphnia pulex]
MNEVNLKIISRYILMDSDIPKSGCIAIEKKVRSTQPVPPTLSPRSIDPQTGGSEWKLVVPMSKR